MKSSEKAEYSHMPVKNQHLSLEKLIARQENLISTIPDTFDKRWLASANACVQDFDSFTADGSEEWEIADKNTDLLIAEIEMI